MILEDVYKENRGKYLKVIILILLLEIIRVILIKSNKILDNLLYVFILFMHLSIYKISVEGLQRRKFTNQEFLKKVLKISILTLIILVIFTVYIITDLKFNLNKVIKVVVLSLLGAVLYPSFYYIMYWDSNIKEGLKKGYLVGVKHIRDMLIFIGVRVGLKYLLYLSYNYKPKLYFIFVIIELIYFTYMNLNIMNLMNIKMEG